MDRLTKKKIDIEKFSERTKSRLTQEYLDITKLNNKLCEYEDFMEEQGFESFNELKQYYVNLIELKDWIEDRIDGTESDNGIYTEFHSGQCNAYCKVLDKLNEMQELEKDDE